MKKKQQGVTLLEVLLSLVIIALMILLATRYYLSTNSSRQVNTASKMMVTSINAIDHWRWIYRNIQNPYANLSTKALNDMNLIPDDFITDNANPWGGKIDIKDKDKKQTEITMTNVPAKDCLSLQDMMAQKKVDVQCKDENMIALYPTNLIKLIPPP